MHAGRRLCGIGGQGGVERNERDVYLLCYSVLSDRTLPAIHTDLRPVCVRDLACVLVQVGAVTDCAAR